MLAAPYAPGSVSDFLRAGPERLHDWVLQCPWRLILFCVTAIVLGAGT
jgi:hypothetical protein